MTTEAENSTAPAGDPAPAAGAELTIPKYRLDEAAAEIRRLREEVQMKDRLYMEDRQRMNAPQQTQVLDPTPEETGLDPQTHAAMIKVAKLMADRAVKQKEGIFSQQIGMVASRAEKAELLATRGAGAAKNYGEIEKIQQDHYRATGGYMPADTALDIYESKLKDEKIRRLEAQLAGKPVEEQVTKPTSVPSASGTRQIPTSGATAPAAGKSFAELTIEEMEARIDGQLTAGERF